jgi:K+-transporting ATPase ATPase A chain
MILIFLIPAGLTYTYGRMTRDQKQGWCIFAAMSVLFLTGVATAYWAESKPNPALGGMPVNQSAGNLEGRETRPAGNFEGKETRFGVANSALWATITTDTSCGAVNAMHDSFNPLGGLVTMIDIKLGEVIFGGVGVGLTGMLIFVVLSVFIAGLMVGRTPEYLGKKIETFPTHGPLFVALLVGVVVIVGALTFFPALSLGPVVEHFLMQQGRLWS